MSEQPTALRLAEHLESELPMGWMVKERAAAAELRRLHQHELAHIKWLEKTEWVQDTAHYSELGEHRADVIKQRFDRLHKVNQELLAALKLALRTLEYIHEGANNQGPHTGISWRCVSKKAEPAITAIREALAEPNAAENNGGKTGWPPGLLQDDCKGLSKWLSKHPDARRRVREALADHIGDANKMAEQPAQGCDYCNHPQYAGTKCKNCGREQPAQQQEPVACKSLCELCVKRGYNSCANAAQTTPIPSPQPSKPWVGLTDEEIKRMAAPWFLSMYWSLCNTFARAIEAKLKDKNGY